MPEVKVVLKLQAPGGQAVPGQKIATTLGPHGVNMQQFITTFNELTKEMRGDIIPVEITVYTDRTMSLKLKTPPAAELLKKAAKIEKGSGTPNTAKVGTVTREQIRVIAERKMPDLSARDVEAAMKIIEGSARSLGLNVK